MHSAYDANLVSAGCPVKRKEKTYSGEILPTAGLISTLTRLRSGVFRSLFNAYAMTAFPPLYISVFPIRNPEEEHTCYAQRD
jgi:hypothetical protein